jgi:hypothetical protein
MKSEYQMPNAGGMWLILARTLAVFGFPISGFFRHSSFVIRILNAGR